MEQKDFWLNLKVWLSRLMKKTRRGWRRSVPEELKGSRKNGRRPRSVKRFHSLLNLQCNGKFVVVVVVVIKAVNAESVLKANCVKSLVCL